MRRPQWSPRPRATSASSCPGPSLLGSPRSLLSPRYAGALPGRAPTTLPRMTTTRTSERAGLQPRDSIVPRSSARAARRLHPAAAAGTEALGLHREAVLLVPRGVWVPAGAAQLEAVQEGQGGVGWAVAGGSDVQGGSAGECWLLQLQIGVEVHLRGLNGLMTQPENDHRTIHAVLEEIPR